MPRITTLVIFVLVMLGFLAAFLSGFFLNSYFESRTNEFPILNQAYNILVNHSSIALAEPPALEYGMIRGLLESSNDPYAVFQEPVQHELESNNLEGSYGGIGVEITVNPEGEFILIPISGGPASDAGIQSGDQLLKIDDLIIIETTNLDQVKAAIRGPTGSTVKIKVFHDQTGKNLEFDITREVIHLPSVSWYIAPGNEDIGILDVHIIADSTAGEIENAVRQLKSGGAKKFILDLRDNGGGLLTAGVDTARLFLEEGIIIQQQYRNQDAETFRVTKPGALSDLPLVILINRNTASAAEIIAGAMKMHDKAILIGENSFGKDSIQLIFDLDDGSSLHVTAAKWWLPGLKPVISEGGLQPDILVRQHESEIDSILNAAIDYLRDR